jgi:hypothetical protein
VVGRQTNKISIWLDPSVNEWWTLNLDGSFSAYANYARKPPETGPGHFRTDEEVWQAAEAIVAQFDPPPGLLRHKLKRQRENTDVIYCEFNVKPYGYWSEAGNSASISFQASDGAVLHLIVGRGWNYEPPNIRISEEEARAIASAQTQRDPGGWRYAIKWTTSTPDLERRGVRKTQRLIYSMYREDSDDGVLIDTVTGEVVAALTGLAGKDLPGVQNEAAKPVTSHFDNQESQKEPRPGKGMAASPYFLPAVGLLSILVAIAAWRARNRVADR